jgi:hypothetical protein
MGSKVTTTAEYLEELAPERRALVGTLRQVVLANLPKGYEEQFRQGIIAYVIPLDRYPKTYSGRPLVYVSLASQKNYVRSI